MSGARLDGLKSDVQYCEYNIVDPADERYIRLSIWGWTPTRTRSDRPAKSPLSLWTLETMVNAIRATGATKCSNAGY